MADRRPDRCQTPLLQSGRGVLYPGGTSEPGCSRSTRRVRRQAPVASEPRRTLFCAAPSRSPEPPMAESTSVALAAASIPSSADIARAEKFVRERFLHEGEEPAVALARGHAAPPRARRRAGRARRGPKARFPPPRGGGSSRCCSASSGSSPTRSRSSPTARCSPRTRSTPSRAPSPRCWRRRSAASATATAAPRRRLPRAAGLGGDPRPR